MARRFHDARFDSNRFDSAAPDTAWPAYLRQEYPLLRVDAIMRREVALAHVTQLQRNRQRPMSAWAPHRNQISAYPVMFVPWRTWIIRGR